MGRAAVSQLRMEKTIGAWQLLPQWAAGHSRRHPESLVSEAPDHWYPRTRPTGGTVPFPGERSPGNRHQVERGRKDIVQ